VFSVVDGEMAVSWTVPVKLSRLETVMAAEAFVSAGRVSVVGEGSMEKSGPRTVTTTSFSRVIRPVISVAFTLTT
jgi:hypothetical protein